MAWPPLLLGFLQPVDQRAELRVRPLPLLAVLLALDRLFLLDELGEERLVVLGGRRRQVGTGDLLRLGLPFDAGGRDRVTEIALLGEQSRLGVRPPRRRCRNEERNRQSLSRSHELSFLRAV